MEEGPFEDRDKGVEDSLAEFQRAVKPFLLVQGAALILGAVSIFLYFLWP
jgi:hypothetical protein